MDIGERIKRRREELNVSQAELARMVGYTSRSTITRIERDGNGISQDKIVAIAKALKTTPSYLMGWEEADVAMLTAMQEDTMAKFLMLTHEHQLVVKSIVDTLTEQEKG
jgi:transcriptional regulator with XRE-family HTH domain